MFNETRLLDKVSYGSEFGQEFNTRIVTLRSGVERRNIMWSMPLGRYSVNYQAILPEHHDLVRGAHMASMGSAIPFRLKDWTDFTADGEVIGEADGDVQSLQLAKTYNFGSFSLTRPIKKPVTGKVQLFANGTPIASTVNYTTGIATFSADDGDEISWSGEFDVPVRFESDKLDVQPAARVGTSFALVCNVDLVEIRL